ncbi:hypothetical protein NC651_006091 [Populus alba x Populus x berolinensis]|nr:hypothetical protein NC651_006091 [Populus alba x Populus x berolinensis]
MLLYKSERQQYADAIADDVSPSMVYGAEHLLRLFGNRCSIQFYATLVLIGGFMVFRPKNMNSELVIFFWFVAIINPDYHRKHSTALTHFLQKNQSAFLSFYKPCPRRF